MLPNHNSAAICLIINNSCGLIRAHMTLSQRNVIFCCYKQHHPCWRWKYRFITNFTYFFFFSFLPLVNFNKCFLHRGISPVSLKPAGILNMFNHGRTRPLLDLKLELVACGSQQWAQLPGRVAGRCGWKSFLCTWTTLNPNVKPYKEGEGGKNRSEMGDLDPQSDAQSSSKTTCQKWGKYEIYLFINYWV